MTVQVGDVYAWPNGFRYEITAINNGFANVRQTRGGNLSSVYSIFTIEDYWQGHKVKASPIEAVQATDILEQDIVNHPSHYKFDNGVEVIDLTEQLNFCVGNAIKYLARAGRKDPDKAIEDLEKAEFYVKREIARLKRNT